MIKLSLAQAVSALKRRDFSANELLDATFAHIKSINYNAILSICEERAYEAARRIDSGETCGALAGIPIIIKDNIKVRGLPVTCGSLLFRDNIADCDAFVVKKLESAGAVIIGKANMDEFAMGSSNMTSAFGRVMHPSAAARVPGGSSGGSACAVATYQCFAALGSDTGGSIRQPASYCGIAGLKPTFGSVSRAGTYPLAPSFDQIGPMTRTVRDCAAVFGVICGIDSNDSSTAVFERMDLPDLSNLKAKPCKIGIIRGLENKLEGDALKAFESAYAALRERGCTFKEVHIPLFDAADYVYAIQAYAETADSLRSFGRDGDRGLLGAEAKKRIILGRFFIDNPDYLEKAAKVREQMTAQITEAAGGCGAIMTPTAPSCAFMFDGDMSDSGVVLSDFYTQPASIAGLPALSVPFYTCGNGLPLGIQLVGRAFSERMLFEAGMLLAGEE